MDKRNLEAFVAGYIEALLWSSTDVVDGEAVSLDDSRFDTSPEFEAECEEQCRSFFEENEADIDAAAVAYRKADGYEYAGHDFALTRNRHGAGFWDGDLPKALGERLTNASKAAGEVYPYLGDDGLVYF